MGELCLAPRGAGLGCAPAHTPALQHGNLLPYSVSEGWMNQDLLHGHFHVQPSALAQTGSRGHPWTPSHVGSGQRSPAPAAVAQRALVPFTFHSRPQGLMHPAWQLLTTTHTQRTNWGFLICSSHKSERWMVGCLDDGF